MTIQKRSNLVLILTIIIAVLFTTPLMNYLQPIGFLFNVVLAGSVGYFLLEEQFLEQFKHFKFKVLLYGLPLTIIIGITFSLMYQVIAGTPTTNNISETISILFIATQVPFMLMGEEILSTNLLLALQNKGVKFIYASILVSILFAAWHVTAYGFHPFQLLFTLSPLRLFLNFIWKRSNSVWVSWICHLIYDLLSLIPMALK